MFMARCSEASSSASDSASRSRSAAQQVCDALLYVDTLHMAEALGAG